MGTVFRKTYTVALPAGAELFDKSRKPTTAERAENSDLRHVVEQFARWKGKQGKTRTAKVTTGNDGALRLLVESGTFVAKYRDGEGIVRTVPTGARTEGGAQSVLADLEQRAEKVRCHILTPAESNTAEFQRLPILEHFSVYLTHLRTRGKNGAYIQETERLALRVVAECGFVNLGDINAQAVEVWLEARKDDGLSARTRNSYLQALSGFCGWCRTSKPRRLLENPLTGAARANVESDRRRQRRSMTEDELRRLLFVARWRPLAEYDRESVRVDASKHEGKAKRSNWAYAALIFDALEAAVGRARERLADNPALVANLERRGRERALVYKTLVLTGLRKGELASLTVGQLDLDAEPPFVVLNAADEKNRQGSTLPLRADLAADLRQWLADMESARQEAARNAPSVRIDSEDLEPRTLATRRMRSRQGQSCQDATTLPPNDRLFDVSTGLVKILDRDLQAAGIAKRDDRGRTLDVHALRHSFGTLLSKGGVAPRTAQAAMRHSSINLTMNVYTDPRLLDLHAAVDALPELSLDGFAPNRQVATGTDGRSATVYDAKRKPLSSLAPTLAPTPCNRGQFGTFAGKRAENSRALNGSACLAVTGLPDQQNEPLSIADNGSSKGWARGLEPPTPRSTIGAAVVPTANGPEVTTTPDSGCTNGCTDESPDGGFAQLLDTSTLASPAALAAALERLSPDERQRLMRLIASLTMKELEG